MITARLRFLVASEQTPVYYASESGENAQLDMQGQFEEVEVEIENGRPEQAGYTLDKEGFQLVAHTSAVTNFYNTEQITDIYNREVQKLVMEATGAYKVYVFDHTHRADSESQRAQRNSREPSNIVHNDYTDKSARQRIIDLLPANEVDELLNRRFAIVNVWRAIDHPAETSQLALCDSTSLKADSGIAVERRAKDRIGELMMANFDKANRWFYFPSMGPEEVLLLKTYDSDTEGRTGFCLHTAFEHPNPPVGAKPRESLETRAFAFFNQTPDLGHL